MKHIRFVFMISIFVLISGCDTQTNTAQAQGKQAPMFEVTHLAETTSKSLDSWFNNWIGCDSRDPSSLFIEETASMNELRFGAADPKIADCCIPAPNVFEFDPDGLVNHWGGPGGIRLAIIKSRYQCSHKDNIWIGGNGRGDSHILKFTRNGEFLAQYGKAGSPIDSHSKENFKRVAEIAFHAASNEALVADGKQACCRIGYRYG